ncbi:MAG: hypothetical protein AAF732_21975 [Pseudomonadota bacterium]
MDLEAEIVELKKRVGLLEGTVASLSGQLRNLQPELLALREIGTDRFDGIDLAIDKIQRRIERVDLQVWSLRDDLPTLIADAVRRALGPTT